MFHRFDENPPVNTSAAVELRKTALNSIHRRLGAKMVNFGGWDMPLEYSGILAEHEAVRTRAGLFDVSHMGELEIRGPGALQLVQWVTCNNAAKLADRPSPLFRPDDLPRHLRRRPASPQNFRHALLTLRQRQQPGRGLRPHRRQQQIRRPSRKCRPTLFAASDPRPARKSDPATNNSRPSSIPSATIISPSAKSAAQTA